MLKTAVYNAVGITYLIIIKSTLSEVPWKYNEKYKKLLNKDDKKTIRVKT